MRSTWRTSSLVRGPAARHDPAIPRPVLVRGIRYRVLSPHPTARRIAPHPIRGGPVDTGHCRAARGGGGSPLPRGYRTTTEVHKRASPRGGTGLRPIRPLHLARVRDSDQRPGNDVVQPGCRATAVDDLRMPDRALTSVVAIHEFISLCGNQGIGRRTACRNREFFYTIDSYDTGERR